MIKTKITRVYPHHLSRHQAANASIFVADYTEQTKTLAARRSVEVFVGIHPTDISFFSVLNKVPIVIGSITFDQTSFLYPNRNIRSQCECAVFPESSSANSWILFMELKYSSQPSYNEMNILKAIKQLYKTRTYYFHNGVISRTNTCYLLASLPMQAEPFANFSLTPTQMLSLKNKHNVILRLKNSVEIIDDKTIDV